MLLLGDPNEAQLELLALDKKLLRWENLLTFPAWPRRPAGASLHSGGTKRSAGLAAALAARVGVARRIRFVHIVLCVDLVFRIDARKSQHVVQLLCVLLPARSLLARTLSAICLRLLCRRCASNAAAKRHGSKSRSHGRAASI